VPNAQPPHQSTTEITQEVVEKYRACQQRILEDARVQCASYMEQAKVEVDEIERKIMALSEDSRSAHGPAASKLKVSPVRPERYDGLTKFEALVEYLRKYPRLQPVHVSEIRKGLLAEGLVLSEKLRPGMTRAKSEEATLLTTAHNHSDVLGREKRTIWLLEPNYPFPRSRKKR